MFTDKKLLWVAGLLCGFAIVFCFASEEAEAALFETAQILDQADEFALQEPFEAVGLLVGFDSEGGRFAAGTGTLYNRTHVLTAGHVPFDEPGVQWTSMQFVPYADSLANLDDNAIDVSEWFVFPGYDSGLPAGQGNDIAVVRLSEPILDVDPMPLFFGDDSWLIGQEVMAGGYGNPDVWPSDNGTFDGIRRAGENIVDCFGCDVQIESQFLEMDFGPAFNTTTLAMEWTGSKNDSGGPVFGQKLGHWGVVGVNSAVFGANTTTIATRVAPHESFITSVTVPEPGTLGSAAIGFLFLLGFRRFRNRH